MSADNIRANERGQLIRDNGTNEVIDLFMSGVSSGAGVDIANQTISISGDTYTVGLSGSYQSTPFEAIQRNHPLGNGDRLASSYEAFLRSQQQEENRIRALRTQVERLYQAQPSQSVNVWDEMYSPSTQEIINDQIRAMDKKQSRTSLKTAMCENGHAKHTNSSTEFYFARCEKCNGFLRAGKALELFEAELRNDKTQDAQPTTKEK